jgi:uncharacterized peroxidase-related enzyme
MTRIHPINADTASAEQKQLLAGVKQAMGIVPNLVSTMAHSPAVANAYLAFNGALAKGVLSPQMREKIILAVSQANDCDYCVAAHCALGAKAGLSAAEIEAARKATCGCDKTAAALGFAAKMVEARGKVVDADVANLRSAGWNDPEITEIIANVALSLFTNYFNHVAGTEVDFPTPPEVKASCCSAKNDCAGYTLFETGALKDWVANSVELPGLGKVPGKLFIKEQLGLTASQISVNAMQPGEASPIYHSHKQNEEVYIFTHGQGQMQINGKVINVREGSIVRVSPSAERTWRNNSKTTLIYIVAQMRSNSLEQYGVGDAIVPAKKVTWPD